MLKIITALFFTFNTPVLSYQTGDNPAIIVGDREITKAEYMARWEKNLLSPDPLTPEEHLRLFIEMQLKLEDARDKGFHKDSALLKELALYRERLARSYLTDSEAEETLAREAHERLMHEINASHILVKLPPGYGPGDTLQAYEKALEIRERIISGDVFERVARATSDDPSARINSGNLGYFTVFHTTYPFETYVYNARLKNLSMPVRTRFGYHIIRVNDRIESRGEVNVAHILIGFDNFDEAGAEKKAGEIYNKISSGGADFKEMAKEFSTDRNTSSRGGELPWFGSGTYVSEFEDAAFGVSNIGDITEPFRTPYGWHILKLLDKREVPAFEEIRETLIEKVRNSGDERSLIVREAMLERLKEEWNFSERREALRIFYNLIDERIFEGNWEAPSFLSLNDILFTIDGVEITQRDFARFIEKNAYIRNPWPVSEYIEQLYHNFVSSWLISHEEKNLGAKYPEFRYTLNQYKEGFLLYEISQKRVWSKVRTDTEGFEHFYNSNIERYMWDERAVAKIYSTEDADIANRVARRARLSRRFSFLGDEWIIARFNRRNDNTVTVAEGIYSQEDHSVISDLEMTRKVSEVIYDEGRYHVVLIHDILPPEPKSFEDKSEQILSDYHDHLYSNWMEELSDRYNVVVNSDVLNVDYQ